MRCKLSKRGCGWLLRDHCLTFGDGICLSGGWDSRTHHIVYCLKKGGMLSDFVKVIMCNISMRMMPTMAKLVFLAAGVYLRRSTQWREVQLDLVTCCHWPQGHRMTKSS